MKDRLSACIHNIDLATLNRICAALSANNRPANKGADRGTITVPMQSREASSHVVTATTRNLIARAKDAALGARIARAVISEEG